MGQMIVIITHSFQKPPPSPLLNTSFSRVLQLTGISKTGKDDQSVLSLYLIPELTPTFRATSSDWAVTRVMFL